jgi:hypothetical protein
VSKKNALTVNVRADSGIGGCTADKGRHDPVGIDSKGNDRGVAAADPGEMILASALPR